MSNEQEDDTRCNLDAKKRKLSSGEPKVYIKNLKTNEEKVALFEIQYKLLQQMREKKDAPVDTMGCNTMPTPNATEADRRYRILLSLMLSAQTKDEINARAMKKLCEHGCTMSSIADTSAEKLAELIYPVGFYRRKAEYIKKTTNILLEKYNGDIPCSIKELTALPGVGPKMAYLCMAHAWNKVVGIGVDVHVHRISNRLGWVDTKTPEKTRKELESFVPQEYWREINTLLVGFGQTVCKPIGPKCSQCKLRDYCEYYAQNGEAPKKRQKRKKKNKKNEILVEEQEEEAEVTETAEDIEDLGNPVEEEEFDEE